MGLSPPELRSLYPPWPLVLLAKWYWSDPPESDLLLLTIPATHSQAWSCQAGKRLGTASRRACENPFSAVAAPPEGKTRQPSRRSQKASPLENGIPSASCAAF